MLCCSSNSNRAFLILFHSIVCLVSVDLLPAPHKTAKKGLPMYYIRDEPRSDRHFFNELTVLPIMRFSSSMSRTNHQRSLRFALYSLLVSSVVSFAINTNVQKTRQPTFVRGTLDQLEEAEQPFSKEFTTNLFQKSFRGTELWLDLRETAIAPAEALQFLEKNLFSEDENMNMGTSEVHPRKILSLVDKILLSEELFTTIASRDEDLDLPLLYMVNEGSTLVESNSQTKQSFPSGEVVTCRHTEILDPLSAIEITSSGQWLFVDKTDGSDEKEKILWLEKQVKGLVDFLTSASAAPVMSSQNSGLLLPSTFDEFASPVITGGVSISCRTRTVFVQLNAALEQSMGSAMITSTTESGILVTVEPTLENAGKLPALKTALVLPFDLRIWETARDIQGRDEELNDEDDSNFS